MEWTEDAINRLRTMWADGLSTAEIGRRMGVSKNAVVGKAHRLNLSARPSPIRRNGEKTPRRRQLRRAQGCTLPALTGDTPAAAPPGGRIEPIDRMPPVHTRPDRAPPMLRAIQSPRPSSRVTPCCWPIGEPGTRSFSFCDVNAIPGKPYCDEHAALAYVKVRDRRDDAA